nr:alpha/beta fold hydrolase [Actinomycetota bacterium]
MDFVLVHGAYHGAWCWDLVAELLVERGHRVVSMDLPIEDPAAGLLDYRDAVLAAGEGLAAPVVVGHSMAGAVIPLVAASWPNARLVFLSAFVPWPGKSLNQLRASEPLETYRLTNVEFEDLGDKVWSMGAATAMELFFHDLPDEVASWAQKLLRPQSYGVFEESSPLRS